MHKYTVVVINLDDAANGNFEPDTSVSVEHVEAQHPKDAAQKALKSFAHDAVVGAVFFGWCDDVLHGPARQDF